MTTQTTESPAAIIARVDATAERVMTPCGDGQMAWRLWGRGPNVVLLHGNFGSWMHWIRNIEALSRDFRLIVADIPGFGESVEPPKPYSAYSLAQILADGLIAIVGDAKINLAGFSFGGAASSELAYVLGDRMRKLIYISTGRNTGMTRGEMHPFVKWRKLPTQAERDAAHRRNLEVTMIAEPSRIDDLALHIQATNAAQARLRTAIIGEAASTRNRLPHLKCEVAAIWADRDQTIGRYLHERPVWLHRNQPAARYRIIHDAGHWCQYEQPGAFNKIFPELMQ